MGWEKGLVIGLGVAATAVGGYVGNEIGKSVKLQARTELDLEKSLELRDTVQYETSVSEEDGGVVSERAGLLSIGTAVTSFVNNRSIMRGASLPWSAQRLLNGKFQQLRKIGGKGVRLHTKAGDRIFGFYFSLSSFYKKIREMGGKPVVLDIHLDHPFFKTAEGVTLKSASLNKEFSATRIPYSSDMEKLFRNPQEFLQFCAKMNLEIVWEDTFEPFQVASWYHWNSRKQNLLLVSKFDIPKMNQGGGGEDLSVENHPTEDYDDSFFRMGSHKTRAIVFEGNINEVEKVLSDMSGGLKIESSSWSMIEYKGKIYLLENIETDAMLGIVDMKRVDSLPFFRLEETPVDTDNLRKQGGVVVLSMNQTNSFVSYSHEILTFLLSGVNVLVYDNAGKGISRGKNSEYSMTEALRSAGDFLITKKRFSQEKILFKGQCAGGLPTSEAGKMFPRSHVWIDQAPQTFYGAAKNVAHVMSEDFSEKKKEETSLLGRALYHAASTVTGLTPLVESVSSLVLPSYDVVENLKRNRGMHIYTIGVPDEKGYGGDQLVPEEHRKAIQERFEREGGLYLEMPGATHVTDWWKNPDVLKAVKQGLEGEGLSVDAYAIQMAGGRAIIDRKYEAIFGEAYNENTCSDFEFLVYNLFVDAYEGSDMRFFDFDMPDIRVEQGPQVHQTILNACIDIAEEEKNQVALLHYLEYKRKYG